LYPFKDQEIAMDLSALSAAQLVLCSDSLCYGSLENVIHKSVRRRRL